jgi:protein SCO1
MTPSRDAHPITTSARSTRSMTAAEHPTSLLASAPTTVRTLRTRRRVQQVAAAALLAITAAACSNDREEALVGYQLDPMPTVGAFTVDDASHGGGPFPLRAQPDRLLVVFLGFANCPDVCPTALAEVGQVVDRLGPDANRLDVAMLTVDPVRDTPEALTAFAQGFVDRSHALRTEEPAELQAIVDAFGATAASEHDHAGNTTQVGHTDHTYLVDERGDVILTWTADMTADDLTSDLRILIDQLAA